MTTPEPLTTQKIEEIEENGIQRIGVLLSVLDTPTMDRLLYTAKLGAKFAELTNTPKEGA